MIPNITRGANTRGVLLYLVGAGKREEHEEPHLVAGAPEALLMAGERVLEQGDAAALARFIDEPRQQFGTRVTIAERDDNGRVVGSRDAHVWHCSLSLHPDEPALSDERWGELCDEFVASMGFAGSDARAQCRWVAIRHGESAGGSDHAHVVVALVAEDGSKASVHYDQPRAQNAARGLEQRCGLRRLEARARGTGAAGCGRGSGWLTRVVSAITGLMVARLSGGRGRRWSGSSGRVRSRAATRLSSSARYANTMCASVRATRRAAAPRSWATRFVFSVLPAGRGARSGLAVAAWRGI